jgi:hypothetical protein
MIHFLNMLHFIKNPFRTRTDERESLINSCSIDSYTHNFDLNNPEVVQYILNNTNQQEIDKGHLVHTVPLRRSARIANGNHPYRTCNSR